MTQQQPPPGSDPTPEPTSESPQPPPAPPSAQPPASEPVPPPAAQQVPPPEPAQPRSKVATYITFGVIALIVAVLAFFISQNQSAGDLAVGQCFDEPSRDTEISTVVKHACTEAHDAEVFHVVEYTGGDAYPISLSIDSFIDDTCVPAFGPYVGEAFDASADYELGYFYPDRDGWESGDRTFTCYVSRIDGAKLTQSVKVPAAS